MECNFFTISSSKTYCYGQKCILDKTHVLLRDRYTKYILNASILGKHKAKKIFQSTCVSCKAIGDTSSALEFMKILGQIQIPSQVPPVAGLELRWSAIKMLLWGLVRAHT